MTQLAIERYVRPLHEVREIMVRRARGRKNPFSFTDPDRVAQIFESLPSLDRDEWADAFMAAARPAEARAAEFTEAGDTENARRSWLEAYGYYRVARYPTANSPRKREAYERYRRCFLQAAALSAEPFERVEMPLAGPAPRQASVGYLFRPPQSGEPVGVVIVFGGIDTFKEDMAERNGPYLRAGLATLAIDMPGVGEAPVTGADDVRAMWDAVLSWIDSHPELDSGRVAVLARSTGGYWATWLAHTYPERIRASVNHGGPAHHAFTPAWIERAQHGEYPLELAETLAAAWGRSTLEEWLDYAPSLSLLSRGILDGPCAPLLCVNGRDDSVFQITDHHLLLEHGSPKSARFYPGGHMGWTPETEPAITAWILAQLR
jgi:esterase FrsA